MKLLTGIGGWPDTAGAQAQAAEEAGYDMVTCGELSHDSVLTMALAAGRSGVANKMRSLLPKINRASGVLLVLAGIYLVSYGWFEKDPINNSNFIIDGAEGIQSSIVNWITNDLGAERAGLAMLVAIAVIGVGAALWRYQSRNTIAEQD